ncbi:uncharacterized protein LOC143613575 [Bidens hawaiensis]|uniref:uncharacterized protein LOC143613575 n=1 Tax=Bidens hawaiensis TaxID=980011 RepID=UPI00404AD313
MKSGDHIGMESCVDLETTDHVLFSGGAEAINNQRSAWGMQQERRTGRKLKELPPLLPMTVMKRYYTDDGRLVITEEKRIKTPKYCHFTAHRSHGRLTLQLPSEDE